MAEKKRKKERGELPAAEFEFVLTKSDQQDLKDPKDFAAVANIISIISIYIFWIAAFDNFSAHTLSLDFFILNFV